MNLCWSVRIVPAGHQLAPRRAAQRLHVVVLQLDSLRRQPVQGGRLDLGAVVTDIPETLVVHQDEDDVRLLAGPIEVIAAVVPRRLVAPRLRHDEAEEHSQRNPQDQHVSGGLGAPGARWDGSHMIKEENRELRVRSVH